MSGLAYRRVRACMSQLTQGAGDAQMSDQSFGAQAANFFMNAAGAAASAPEVPPAPAATQPTVYLADPLSGHVLCKAKGRSAIHCSGRTNGALGPMYSEVEVEELGLDGYGRGLFSGATVVRMPYRSCVLQVDSVDTAIQKAQQGAVTESRAEVNQRTLASLAAVLLPRGSSHAWQQLRSQHGEQWPELLYRAAARAQQQADAQQPISLAPPQPDGTPAPAQQLPQEAAVLVVPPTRTQELQPGRQLPQVQVPEPEQEPQLQPQLQLQQVPQAPPGVEQPQHQQQRQPAAGRV